MRRFGARSNGRVAGDDCLFACTIKTDAFIFPVFQKCFNFVCCIAYSHVIQKDKGIFPCPPP